MKAFIFLLLATIAAVPAQSAEPKVIEADLLIVGGNESACAAAVQAARLGVKRIVLVNDIDWLGGQFSAEGVGCPDEWTMVNGSRLNFPRSGLFAEVIGRIRAHNSAAYGLASPGNAFCGSETIEPAAAAKIFEELLAGAGYRSLRVEESGKGQPSLAVVRGWQPAKVDVEAGRVIGVEFEPASGGAERFTVRAKLTMDSSDWGDVIRLSGSRYGAGPDLKARFGEPSAPAKFDQAGAQEMNPLSWCVVLRETGGKASIIPRPPSYDARSYAALDKIPPWVDDDMSAGIYSPSANSPYTHRRLVDRWHNGLAAGTEATFLNYPVQDYPLCQLPQRVLDALESTATGASRENIVNLTPAQRRIIFEDARQHTLGMLYHLQTSVHERVGDFPQSFRYMGLTAEFGTADSLPIKPYVREGLRLEALYMMREQDIRAATREPKWAKVMPTDAIFGFQFNIDFHPTRRQFLTADRNGPWQFIHTPSRGWHTDTDRAVFPLRGLVPVEMDGLLAAGKNIGVSSVVQSALRLHGQMMLVGQSSATLAWMSLRDGLQPRAVASDIAKVRELQLKLVRGCGGPGILLWPWQDLAPDDSHFEAVNMLAVRGIWPPEPANVFFEPSKAMTHRELARVIVRLCRALPQPRDWPPEAVPLFADVAAGDPDRVWIEALAKWGAIAPAPNATFQPDARATFTTLHLWLTRLGLPASPGLVDRGSLALTRGEAARHLWRALCLQGEWFPPAAAWLQPGGDHDGDGLKDFDDALPFDRDNNNIPDRLQPPPPARVAVPFGRRVLVCDYGGNKVAIVAASGEIEWQIPAEKPQDVWMLKNGNVLFSYEHGAREVTLAKKTVWDYASPEKTEVHGCQPLADGNVLVVECGPKRLVEVGRDGRIVREIPVNVKTKNLHDEMRGCRRTPDGRYWICAKGDRVVLELDPSGKLLRQLKIPGDPHAVHELPNGHIVVACGEGAAVIEFDHDGKIVWKVSSADLPANPLRLVSGFQRLADGHTIVVNWLGHGFLGTGAQFFELDADKKVVREFSDHSHFTSVNQIQLLDGAGDPARDEVWR